MNTILSFMDKIYGDTKTLSAIYIIGSILLFIFIILLIFSLKKPDKKDTKIIEEPNIDNDEQIVKVDNKDEVKIDETIVNKIEEQKIEIKDELNNNEPIIENKLEDILNVDNKKPIIEDKKEEINISSEIPDIDDYVDNIVNKTYEKNEQFSSVYVNTNTIKLDKVLDKLNVDEDIKEEIVPIEEKSEEKEENVQIDENKTDNKNNVSLNKLEDLKKALELKKESIDTKQDDLKSKLESLKSNSNDKKTNLDELKNKLNSLKNQN